MATRTSTSVRLDDAQVIRLDRIVEAMRTRLAGLDVGRSTALRLALERGMDALEVELRVTARGRKTGPSTTRSKTKRATSEPAKSPRGKPTKSKAAKGKSARSESRKAPAKSGKSRSSKANPAQRTTRARASARR